MPYGIKLRVWGDFALFSRPEMKAERVSYDVPTPSAARGIIEAIYWKPQIRWVIDKIHVLKPIRFTNIRRNELDQKLPPGNVRKAMKGGDAPELLIEDHRQQRASLLLKDVDYVLEAHFEILDPKEENGSTLADPAGKHLDMFNRRAAMGQFHHAPVLGCREFPAHFTLVEDEPPTSELQGETDLGFMLYDIDFANNMTPIFYRARMADGIIDVQKCHRESNVKG